MPDAECLDTADVQTDLLLGARNAVRTCLAVRRKERVVLITDEHTAEIAAAILAELRDVPAVIECFVLERYGERPLAALPGPISRALEGAAVSLMVVTPIPGELKIRSAVMDMVALHSLRHAHMPGVDHEMMVTAMRVDYRKVARVQDRLLERLSPEAVVHVRSPAGTDLELRLTPKHRWVRCDGLIQPGIGQNLPTGQLYTTPGTVEGTFVCDAAIGDWFGTRYSDLSEYPLSVEISGGRARDARSSNQALARQMMLYLRSNVEGDRVGELGIGTNLALGHLRGIALQDEQVPGAHIAFGGAGILGTTGASWSARTQVPLIGRSCDIDFDGTPVMRRGVFEPDILS